MKKLNFLFCVAGSAFCLFAASCKKDSFISSADAFLHITTDTLKYDTVFTTTGSITKFFKIISSPLCYVSKYKNWGIYISLGKKYFINEFFRVPECRSYSLAKDFKGIF